MQNAPVMTPGTDTNLQRSVAEQYLNDVQALIDGKMTPEQVLEKLRRNHGGAAAEARAASTGQGQ